MATSKRRPLVRVQEPQVGDPVLQRAMTTLYNPLAEIGKFLEKFVRPEPWQPLPLLNDWADNTIGYQQAEFKKTPLDEVIIRGVCLSSGGVSVDVGVLPVGYRPKVNQLFPLTILVAGVPAIDSLKVGSDGLLSFDGSLLGAGAKNAILFARFDLE